MAASITALSEKFYNEFQSQRQAISDAVDADREAYLLSKTSVGIQKHQASINELQRNVQDANVFTNSHDQRIYTSGIKNLQDKVEALRDLIKPRGKFSFKSARKTPATPPKAPENAKPLSTSSVNDARIEARMDNLLGNGDKLIERKNVRLSSERTVSNSTTSIQNISSSIVDLTQQRPGQFAGLHIINITGSIVFCGSVSGGLHITNVRDSVLVARTHQFRMHQCSNVVVYLAAGSSPIIEHCSQIKFAPLESHAGDPDTIRNAWNEVSDFQYPGIVGQSPNWSIVPEADRMAIDHMADGGAAFQGAFVTEVVKISDLREALRKLTLVTIGDANVPEQNDALENLTI